MKFNEYIIVRKWQDSGLLKNLSNPVETAMALEGQRIQNEKTEYEEDAASFTRISIPLVRRIFGTCENIHGSDKPQKEWYVCENISLYVPPTDVMHNLDDEAAYCAMTAQRLARVVEELAGNQQLTFHCLALEQLGAVKVFKINYSVEPLLQPTAGTTIFKSQN